jgi:hypothetical protein
VGIERPAVDHADVQARRLDAIAGNGHLRTPYKPLTAAPSLPAARVRVDPGQWRLLLDPFLR